MMDWIAEKLNWTVEKAFDRLCSVMESDICRWQADVGERKAATLDSGLEGRTFLVIREDVARMVRKRVSIRIKHDTMTGIPSGILLERNGDHADEHFLVIVNRKAQPRFRMEDEVKRVVLLEGGTDEDPDFELWQMSRFVLEPLLF